MVGHDRSFSGSNLYADLMLNVRQSA
jgi:hypothetical protein